MDKNTIWAIVLSTLVIIASYLILPKFFPGLNPALGRQSAQTQTEENTELSEPQELDLSAMEENAAVFADSEIAAEESEADEQSTLVEQKYTIKTDKVEVVFTNKGGDIISYKLLDHKDMDTDDFVQLSDNVNNKNRTLAIAFGKSDAKIVDEIFNTEINDKSITFTKTMNVSGKKTTLRKVYTFMDGEYVFKLDVLIHTADSTGLDVGGTTYTLRTSPQIGPHYDIKKNLYDVRQVLGERDKKKLKKSLSNKVYTWEYEWAGVGGKYFTILIKPEDTSTMSNNIICSTDSETDYINSQVFLTRNGINAGEPVTVEDTYTVYIGPRSETEYKRYNNAEDNGWGISNARFNYALQSTGFLVWLEVPLKWALEMIQKLVKNWGIAIIILTIILRLLLFPLSKKSAEGTLKMQQLQPKLRELQEKYNDNKPKLNEEMGKLYKEAGYNPMSGCLPMILQMFILFALYNVFNNYFEFRGATFVKGWIDDLSVGDSIWSWDKQIPLLSSFTQNHLRILPIIYLVSQLLNGKVTQYGNAGGAQSKGQMAFMMYGLPILFFFMFYSVPSGLLLYWTISNILQIFQQILIQRIMIKKRAELEKGKKIVNKNEIKFKGGKKKTR